MAELVYKSARLGGRFQETVEHIRAWLAQNTGKCSVLCLDPEMTRKKFEGFGLDLDRVDFIAPPPEEPLPQPASNRGQWIRRLMAGADPEKNHPPDGWPLFFRPTPPRKTTP